MSVYKYLIVDDDDMDRLTTSYYLRKYPFLEHKASFSSSKDALNYLENNEVEVLFLDIDIPDMNGMDFFKIVKDNVKCIILITSHPEFAVDGFDLNAFDYIIKPLSKERFDECISRLKEYLELQYKVSLFEDSFGSDSIMVKEGYHYVKLRPYEVVYLEALKDYTKIVLLDKKTTTVHGNLRGMLNNDNFKDFVRIHKSYAVQRRYIKAIKANEMTMINDIVIPIGQNYKKDLLNLLT